MNQAWVRLTAAVLFVGVIVYWAVTNLPDEDWAIGMEGYSLHSAALKVVAIYLSLLLCYLVLGRGPWKPRLARVLLNLASLGLVVSLVELPAVLGLLDYRVLLFPRSMGGKGPHNIRFDPEFVGRRPPHDHFVEDQPGDMAREYGIADGARYRTECRYDRHGFRNPTDFQRAAVVLLGDSFVEGYKVQEEETCRARLSRMLKVDVCNLGQVDCGPGRQLVVLRKLGLELNPQIVVWFFFEGNDLRDLGNYQGAMRDWEGFLGVMDGPTSRCFLPSVLESWIPRLRPRDPDRARKRSGRLLPGIGGGTMYFGLVPRGLRPSELTSLAESHAILKAARSLCDENDTKFLVVNIPTKFRVYQDVCTLPPDGDLSASKLNDLPSRLGRLCAEADIPYVDLTSTLQSAAQRGRPVYYLDDGHWSGDGNAVAAEQIATFIREAGWEVPIGD